MPNVAPVAIAAAPITTNAIQGARPKSKNFIPQNFCLYCNIKGHHTDDCQHFPSVTERRAVLKANGRCENCRGKKKPGHRCYLRLPCKICNGWHKWQLCAKGDNDLHNPK